jgi:hypothetical protein
MAGAGSTGHEGSGAAFTGTRTARVGLRQDGADRHEFADVDEGADRRKVAPPGEPSKERLGALRYLVGSTPVARRTRRHAAIDCSSAIAVAFRRSATARCSAA